MTDEALIERMARALTTACGRDPDAILNEVPEWVYRQIEAKAALAASDRADLVRRVEDLETVLAEARKHVAFVCVSHVYISADLIDARDTLIKIDATLNKEQSND